MALSAFYTGHASLLYAILAQAAGNLAHLGYQRETMLGVAMRLYGAAVGELGRGIRKVEFSVLVATVLALIMAEVCGIVAVVVGFEDLITSSL